MAVVWATSGHQYRNLAKWWFVIITSICKLYNQIAKINSIANPKKFNKICFVDRYINSWDKVLNNLKLCKPIQSFKKFAKLFNFVKKGFLKKNSYLFFKSLKNFLVLFSKGKKYFNSNINKLWRKYFLKERQKGDKNNHIA